VNLIWSLCDLDTCHNVEHYLAASILASRNPKQELFKIRWFFKLCFLNNGIDASLTFLERRNASILRFSRLLFVVFDALQSENNDLRMEAETWILNWRHSYHYLFLPLIHIATKACPLQKDILIGDQTIQVSYYATPIEVFRILHSMRIVARIFEVDFNRIGSSLYQHLVSETDFYASWCMDWLKKDNLAGINFLDLIMAYIMRYLTDGHKILVFSSRSQLKPIPNSKTRIPHFHFVVRHS
jgi:hypothetical protein